ncbi:MAG: hypothetical protein NXI27_07070 [Alphaproteobacteria bacterium]|nr:hypothetical protein [Alphaproteobacteria bacterium]
MFDDRKIGRNNTLSNGFDMSARPIVTVDTKKYQSFLDGAELSEAQKEEFLQSLWLIMMNFVELGFCVQERKEACGQNQQESKPSAKESFDQVSSKDTEELIGETTGPPELHNE